jgi:hypothetical protein
MFCLECGAHLQKSDRVSIEKKIEQSSCQSCGHFNSIESKRCSSCGTNLRESQAAVYRDPHGRLRMVREAPLRLPTKLLCLTTVMLCLALAGQILWFQTQITGLNPAKLWGNRVAVGAAAYLLIGAMVLGSKYTRLDYKARAHLVLALVSLYVLTLFKGVDFQLWKDTTLDLVLLWAHTAGLIYCLIFLLRAEFLRNIFTIFTFMLGVWCSFPTFVQVFSGIGFTAFLHSVGHFAGLPWYLTPGFLTFNIFLPYVFLMMLAHLGHQWAETRSFVVNTPTDRAVLRKFRQRALRGVVLDLFVSSLIGGIGLWSLHLLHTQNLLTPLIKFWSYLTR